MRRRGIFQIVLLTIITCGIYGIIAAYQVFSDINLACRENDTAAVDLLLSFVTCGIWYIYCFYKYSKKIAALGEADNTIINVLLAVLGWPIISICILQSSMNNIVDRNQMF